MKSIKIHLILLFLISCGSNLRISKQADRIQNSDVNSLASKINFSLDTPQVLDQSLGIIIDFANNTRHLSDTTLRKITDKKESKYFYSANFYDSKIYFDQDKKELNPYFIIQTDSVYCLFSFLYYEYSNQYNLRQLYKIIVLDNNFDPIKEVFINRAQNFSYFLQYSDINRGFIGNLYNYTNKIKYYNKNLRDIIYLNSSMFSNSQLIKYLDFKIKKEPFWNLSKNHIYIIGNDTIPIL